MKLIHITDPHLVAPGETLHGLDPAGRLRACVDDILDHHADARALVVTGDLTHRGERAGYALLREQLSRLAMPAYPLMGNHDRRSVFRSVFPDALDDGDGYVQGVLRLGRDSLLMLDTLAEGENGGRYCAARLHWLERALRAEAGLGQRVLVFLHHPPFPIGIPSLDRMALFEPGPLRHVLTRHGNVRHIFFGHVHRPVCGNWCGISYSTMRGLNHQVPFDLTTVAPVPKSHEPPAYAVVLLDADTLVTHFHDFLDRSRLPAQASQPVRLP